MELRDPVTFGHVYDEHSAGVYGAAMRVLGNPAQAQDVAQDVFLRLWRNPGKFDAGRGEIGSYLRLMARSRALDLWRTSQASGRATDRLKISVGREDVAGGEHPAPVVEREERPPRRCATRSAVLPLAQREARRARLLGRADGRRDGALCSAAPLVMAKPCIRPSSGSRGPGAGGSWRRWLGGRPPRPRTPAQQTPLEPAGPLPGPMPVDLLGSDFDGGPQRLDRYGHDLQHGAEWFDAHTHIGDNDPNGSTATVEDKIIAGFHQPRHRRAMVFAMHEPDGYAPANDRVLRAAADSDGRLVPLARVSPHHEDAVAEARRCRGRARGFKLHPRSDEFALPHLAVEQVVALADADRLPVLFHAGRGIPHRRGGLDLARRYPGGRLSWPTRGSATWAGWPPRPSGWETCS